MWPRREYLGAIFVHEPFLATNMNLGSGIASSKDKLTKHACCAALFRVSGSGLRVLGLGLRA